MKLSFFQKSGVFFFAAIFYIVNANSMRLIKKQLASAPIEKDVIFLYVHQEGTKRVDEKILEEFVRKFLEVVEKQVVPEEPRIAIPVPYKKELPMPKEKGIYIVSLEWSGSREPMGKGLAQYLQENYVPNQCKFIAFAYGVSANVVARASRDIFIDTIIVCNPRVAEKTERFKPKRFNRLFNIYSKTSLVKEVGLVGFTKRLWKGEEIFERKYQQQETFNLKRFIRKDIGVPVKNIRVLHVDKTEKMADVSDDDMHRKEVLLHIPTLLTVIERDYKLNFDFIAKLEKEKIEPLVVINRLVFLEKKKMCFPTGDDIKTCIPFPLDMKKYFKDLFTKELKASRRSYINFLNFKVGKTWSEVATNFFGKGLTNDIDAIRKRYDDAKKSELYEFTPAEIINEREVKKYFDNYYPDFDFEEIKSLISKGGKFAYYLTYAETEEYQRFIKYCEGFERPRYLETIIALMWYFFAEAINKGQGFHEGSFILRNKNFSRIFDFLHTYVKKFGTTELEGSGKLRGKMSSNPFAYPRSSSHFQFEGEDKMQHFGIDIRFTKYSPALSLLPAKMRHILFGKIEKGEALFIKLEHNGIYKYEVPFHGLNLIKAQVGKLFAKSISAKLDAPDDAPNYRKERVPKREQVYFEEVFKVKAIGKEEYNIKFMLGEARKKFAEDKDFITFYEWLIRKYDYAEKRYGREVILTDLEFLSSLFYHKENSKIKDLLEETIALIRIWRLLKEKDFREFHEKKLSNIGAYFKNMLKISINRLKVLSRLEKLLDILKKDEYKIDYSIMFLAMKSILQKFSDEIEMLKNQYKKYWEKGELIVHLDVLGLKSLPRLKELRSKYKTLSKKFHPDRHEEQYEKDYFTLKFQLISDANEYLTQLLRKK